jgi:hypothetical protein
VFALCSYLQTRSLTSIFDIVDKSKAQCRCPTRGRLGVRLRSVANLLRKVVPEFSRLGLPHPGTRDLHGVGRPCVVALLGGRRATRGRHAGAPPTSSAGHGVHRSKSTITSALPTQKVHHRGHRDHREALPSLARAARIPPSSVPSVPSVPSVSSVSSVVNPSSAGHGLHRPFSNLAPSASIRVHLRSSAAPLAFSAGHGVHRSFSPAIR